MMSIAEVPKWPRARAGSAGARTREKGKGKPVCQAQNAGPQVLSLLGTWAKPGDNFDK